MSVILITEHDENIYNSTKKQTTYHKKSPRYKSKFRERVKVEVAANKCKTHATMGLALEPRPNPCNFLKKHSWKPAPIKQITPERDENLPLATKREKLPAVPKTSALLEEQRRKKHRPIVNFIVNNIKKFPSKKPNDSEQNIIVTRHGTKKYITEGLEPQYIHSSVYGKTPTYLERIIKIKERELQRQKDTSGTEQPKCRYITREQREELLAGLKQNWEELQKQYQGLPILTDTIPKINRKSKLEADLKQLEKDIVLLERHPYIYVYDDDELN